MGPSHLLAAAAILGLLVMPVAFASQGGPAATKSASLTKQIKKLQRRVAALEAKPGVPSSLPPSGPAGGDLTGAYPNPAIADNAVGSPEIAPDAVRAGDLPDFIQVTQGSVIPANGVANLTVPCPAGTQVINGGGDAGASLLKMVESFQSGNGWTVTYDSDSALPELFSAVARCLIG